MFVKLVKYSLICISLAFIFLFWLAYLSERPRLSIDPQTLAGDGSGLNYCEIPTLKNDGLLAADIPKGNTPGCAYEQFPLPILRHCTESLPRNADDIRGLWRVIRGTHTGHIERIEQCGERVVVTAAGIIHDYGPNSTGGLNTNDTEGSVLFTANNRDFCMRTSASMVWEDGILDFYAFGWGPKVVRRYRDGENLIWEYADGSINTMERICELPDEYRTPKPRGPRYKLF